MGMMGCYSVAVVILRLGFATKIDTTPFQLRDGRKEKATFLVPELTENFIIVPERKLLFCYIEKVGATSFNRFFYDLRNTTQPDPHCCGMWWTNTPRRLGYSLAGVERILRDASWHKAVFYRDPVVRYVSSFLSKCTDGHDLDRWHCENEFGSVKPPFRRAVRRTASRRAHGDVHWQPQARFCGGLAKSLRYYDTVVEFDGASLRTDVLRMLRRAGFAVDAPSLQAALDANFPAQPATESDPHATHSAARAATMVTGGDWEVIVRAYAEDYALFPGLKKRRPPRYAWATMASAEAHMRDATAMMRSLRAVGTIGEQLLLLFGEERLALRKAWRAVLADIKITTALVAAPIGPDDVLNPVFRGVVTRSGKWWDWVKLCAFLAQPYEKVVFLDSDLLFLANVDELFLMPDGTHADGPFSRLNSGLVVLKPSEATFRELVRLVLAGDFDRERGWERSQTHDDVPRIGGETTQGLLHYFYDVKPSTPAKLLDRSVYNYQDVEPAPTGVKVVHFTACGKPYDIESNRKCPTFKARWDAHATRNAAVLATAEATTARSSLRSYTSRLFTKKPTDDRTASRARVADARMIVAEERTRVATALAACAATSKRSRAAMHLVSEPRDAPFRYRAVARPQAGFTFAVAYARAAPVASVERGYVASVLLLLAGEQKRWRHGVANIRPSALHAWRFTCALTNGTVTTGEVRGRVEASHGFRPHIVVRCHLEDARVAAAAAVAACDQRPAGFALVVTGRFNTAAAYAQEPYVARLPLLWEAVPADSERRSVAACVGPIYAAPTHLYHRMACWYNDALESAALRAAWGAYPATPRALEFWPGTEAVVNAFLDFGPARWRGRPVDPSLMEAARGATRMRIDLWWAYHRRVGVDAAFIYDRRPPSDDAPLSGCSATRGAAPTMIDAWQPGAVAAAIFPLYRSMPYYDQPAMYAHCWLKHGPYFHWLVNIDLDEFLTANAVGGTGLDAASRPVAAYFDSLRARTPPAVARVNLPRVTLVRCPNGTRAASGRHTQRLTELWLRDAVFCGDANAVRRAANGTSLRCRLERGGVYQKSAYRPDLATAVDTHYTDYPLGVYAEEGLFITHGDLASFDSVAYGGLYVLHHGAPRSETRWAAANQSLQYIFDNSISNTLWSGAFGLHEPFPSAVASSHISARLGAHRARTREGSNDLAVGSGLVAFFCVVAAAAGVAKRINHEPARHWHSR